MSSYPVNNKKHLFLHEDELHKRRLDFYTNVIEHLPLLLNQYELIMGTPEYAGIPIPDDLDSFDKQPQESPPGFHLGELLCLWKNGEWMTSCPVCDSPVYLTGIGGSPLSGSGSGWGFCSGCHQVVSHIQPFGKYYGQYRNRAVPKGPVSAQPVRFSELLEILKAR